MKKQVPAILPFLCMFLLSTGSVVLSCATSSRYAGPDKKISLNTGSAQDGKIYTIWVFDRIQSVMIVDRDDRSRKIELGQTEWRYDPATTELSILKEIPFKNYFASIEAFQATPHAFILNGIRDVTELMVIVSDRLAIDGYDYSFDPAVSRLTFRSDVNLKESDWSIQYSTPFGGTMLGEWKPENADRMSYLEAEHRKRWIDSWYDRQTAFWFLDASRMDEWKKNPAQPPALVLRAATSEELAGMKADPVKVLKFRTGANERNLSREIGFDSRVPDKLESTSPQGEFPLAWKTIEESSRDGKLERELNVVYEDGTENGLGQYVLDITMGRAEADTSAAEKSEWLIDEETLDLGAPVRVTRQWGTQCQDINAKPAVVRCSAWTWTDGDIFFRANTDSQYDGRSAALIRQFIAARKGAKSR